MHKCVLVLIAAFVLASCDASAPEPTAPSQFIRGEYEAKWVEQERVSASERIEIHSTLTVEMMETEGIVTPFPVRIGTLLVERRRVVRGRLVSTDGYIGDIRDVTGTYDRDAHEFEIRFQGERDRTAFDITFEGRMAVGFTRLIGQMTGEVTQVNLDSGDRDVVQSFDDPVLMDQLSRFG